MDVLNFCKSSPPKLTTWKAKMSRVTILTLAIVLVSCTQGNGDQSRPDYAYKRTRRIVSLVEEAATLIQREGEKAFPLFREKNSKWFQGDMYLFVYDLKGKNVVHPVQPDFEGQNLIDLQDINGKPVIRLIIDKVTRHDKPSGWVHYMWIRPEEIFPMWKSSYVLKTRAPSGKEYVIGSGLYNMKVEKEFIIEMVDDAVELIKREGKAAFDKFRDKSSEFVFLGNYIFVVHLDGTAVVDPAFPSLEGRNLLNFKDAVGRYVVREMLEKLTGDSTWISYMWPKAGEVRPSRRLAYIRKVKLGPETFIVGSGFSPARPIWMK
ncbi:MAG: cache domain-containing protein [Deltaproteobacteria bacterium]|nr:cache domain-containing protein [Deltaproteobacteria bacterium]